MKKTIKQLFNYVKEKYNEDYAYKILIGLYYYDHDYHEIEYGHLDSEAFELIIDEFLNNYSKDIIYAYSQESKEKIISEKCPTLMANNISKSLAGTDYVKALEAIQAEAELWQKRRNKIWNPYTAFAFNPKTSACDEYKPIDLVYYIFGNDFWEQVNAIIKGEDKKESK